MIAWLNPAALWALPLAAAPVLIHLLRTHHAPRVAFPSLRFVQQSRTAAVRMRLPSDVALLLVRVAIIALAVVALAGPIVLTAARTAAWDSRTARAVVVDVSDSMGVADATGAAPARAAAEGATAELRSATYGVRIDARDLRQGVARAAKWLASSPPARRDVVVISDFQRGAQLGAQREVMTGSSALPIADGIGLRLVPVGRRADTSTFAGTTLLGAGDIASREQSIELTADTTAVVMQSSTGGDAGGLRLVGSLGEERAVARLWRALAIAGTPAGSAGQPIAIQFAGAAAATSPAPIASGWMLGTVLRLRDDPAISPSSFDTPAGSPARSGQATARTDTARTDPWTILAWNPAGAPLVRAAAVGAELLVDVNAPADGLFAAEVVRAALTARVDPTGQDEHEIGRLEEALLSALSRPAGPVSLDAWRTSDASDARWGWLGALILLAVEQWLRGRSAHRIQEVTRVAA